MPNSVLFKSKMKITSIVVLNYHQTYSILVLISSLSTGDQTQTIGNEFLQFNNTMLGDDTGNDTSGTVTIVIRKCCIGNEALSFVNRNVVCTNRLVDKLTDKLPTLYSHPEEKLIPEHYPEINYVTAGLPNCKYTFLYNKQDIWFNLLKDGSAVVGLNYWTIPAWLKPEGEYCVDLVNKEPANNESFYYSDRNYALVFCNLEDFQLYLGIRITSGIFFMISAFALLITMIIYLLIWDYQSIHGRTQFSFFLSYFLYFFFEGSRIFAKFNGLNIEPTRACFIHATIAHYFTVVCSGTSAMMSLDCFVTFWKLRSVRSKSPLELFLYLIAAWVVPLITLSLGLFLHFWNNPDQANLETNGIFQYAHYRCSSPVWEFVYRVQLLLLIVNAAALIGTTYFIIKHFKSTARARANNSRNASDNYLAQFSKSFTLFLKLFLIMGVSWTLGFVDLIYGNKYPMAWPLLLIRAYLSLQGIAIFLIFGLHRQNFQQIARKYPNISAVSWLTKSTVSNSNRQMTSSVVRSRHNLNQI